MTLRKGGAMPKHKERKPKTGGGFTDRDIAGTNPMTDQFTGDAQLIQGHKVMAGMTGEIAKIPSPFK